MAACTPTKQSKKALAETVQEFEAPPMHALACKVPAVDPSLKGLAAVRAKHERLAVQSVINIMMAKPELRKDIRDFAKEAWNELKASETLGSAIVDTSTLDSYSQDTKALWVSASLDIPFDTIGKAAASDRSFLNHCVRMLLVMSGQLKMSALCGDDRVATRAFNFRLGEVGRLGGSRIACMLRPVRIVDNDGVINWAAGVYAPHEDDDGIVSKIIHRPTGMEAAVDKGHGVDFSDGWSLRSNYCDASAMFYKSKVLNWKCARFFTEPAGPHRIKQLKGACEVWQGICQAEFKALQGNNNEAQQREEHLREFHSPGQSQRKTGLVEARKRLSERKEAAERTRAAKIPRPTPS